MNSETIVIAEKHIASAPNEENEQCEICEQHGHGYHFGVFSCRACAAFFRRAVVLNRSYSCQKGGLNCTLSRDERVLCRLCRFNKCLRLGMTPNNVQLNRDRASSTVAANKKGKGESARDNDEKAKETDSSPASQSGELPFDKYKIHMTSALQSPITSSLPIIESVPNVKFTIDLTCLSRNIRSILSSTILVDAANQYASDIYCNAEIYRWCETYAAATESASRGELRKMLTTFNFLTLGHNWKEQFVGAAEYMQHCEEFSLLPIDEKVTMFRSSWCLFRRLERVATSIDLFGEEAITKMKFAIFNNYAIDCDLKMETKDISDISEDIYRDWMLPVELTNQIARPMYEMKITEYELVYMLNQLMWHVEGRNVSEATRSVADAYRERISDELHDYYIHEQKMPRYADRLIKIMELVHLIEKLQYDRQQLLNLLSLFNVCKIELKESDVFDRIY